MYERVLIFLERVIRKSNNTDRIFLQATHLDVSSFVVGTITPINFHSIYIITPINIHILYTVDTPSANNIGASRHALPGSTCTAILLIHLVMICPGRQGLPSCWYIFSKHVGVHMESHLIDTSCHDMPNSPKPAQYCFSMFLFSVLFTA